MSVRCKELLVVEPLVKIVAFDLLTVINFFYFDAVDVIDESLGHVRVIGS